MSSDRGKPVSKSPKADESAKKRKSGRTSGQRAISKNSNRDSVIRLQEPAAQASNLLAAIVETMIATLGR